MNIDHENNAKKETSKNQQNNTLVLKTKTHRPPIRNEFVKRQALIDCLEANIELPLTLISAATGCGKSVTASLWLEQTSHKYGWLSLDEEHNDIQVFITYLATLLNEQWPQQTFGLESLLEGVNLPPNLIVSTFINDLDQLEEPFVLVLDDYHIIKEENIHQIINGILQYPPEHFHLVILTQWDPPLKLARMRAQFRLNELRMKDLAFTDEEAIELRSLIATETSDDQVKMLVKHSEGWITGISVGLMGLAEGIAIEKVIKALHKEGSIISGLFDEVVIQGLPIETQKYLGLTSMLDRFSEDLIRTVISSLNDTDLSDQAGRKLIKSSIEKNLFLIRLDPGGEWYRYHHLFRSQIKSRIGNYFNKELIQKLYKEASIWFQSHNLFEEALKYAILSDDMVFAVGLFESRRIELHNAEQFQQLERLINMFPKNAINNNLELLLSLAILQDHKANYKDMQKYLELAGQILDSSCANDPQFIKLKGQFHGVCTHLPFMQGDYHASIRQAETAMKLLPASEPNYFREYALAYYALGQQAIGKKETGLDLISRTLERPAISDKYFRGRLLHIKTLVHSIAGDANEMRRPGVQLQALHSPQNYPGAWMAGIYATVTSAYISNKLQKVHQFHEELFKYRFTGRPFGVMHHFFVECLASVALGCLDDVESFVANSKELAADLQIPPLQGMVYAFEVEIALMQNKIDYAIEVAALANFSPHPPLWYYYIPQLTEVKLLLYTNERERGLELLEELIKSGKRCHNENLLIQALVLKAVLFEKKGDRQLAVEVLCEALSLSKNKGHIRTFVDHGDVMKQLLREIPEDQSDISQIKELEQAFLNIYPENVSEKIKVSNPYVAVTKLSNREIEILCLVNQGYKNDEIAEELFISLTTVKQHLYRAYQKLDVNNRVSAIKRAKDLDLIDCHRLSSLKRQNKR